MKKRNREERKDRKKSDLGISIVFNSGVEN